MNLTEGAIAINYNRRGNSSRTQANAASGGRGFSPDLVLTKSLELIDRSRFVLSDGLHMHRAILLTPMNHLVNDGNLKAGSIVQLIHYKCTNVEGFVYLS
ncbi:conserved hypothetical protein [Ricinus communis]|uniref:Replication factor-A protein 1 N-terminal domain-containing protein n=1 Tax=Ricinus communis TaxID=3988 RepID=B9T2T4_RICCO|nr:conserved hypothetical protein [Ricinus communis]